MIWSTNREISVNDSNCAYPQGDHTGIVFMTIMLPQQSKLWVVYYGFLDSDQASRSCILYNSYLSLLDHNIYSVYCVDNDKKMMIPSVATITYTIITLSNLGQACIIMYIIYHK